MCADRVPGTGRQKWMARNHVLKQEGHGIRSPAPPPKEMYASCVPGNVANILTLFYRSVLASDFPRGRPVINTVWM